MSLQLCILASGSSGNCAVLRTPHGLLLIDVGIGPRTTARRLDSVGARLDDVSAICLTHLDSDHFKPNWLPTILNQSIPIHCHTAAALTLLRSIPDPHQRARLSNLLHPFESDSFSPLPALHLQPLKFQHDHAGSHGFHIKSPAGRVGYATDLGQVTPQLIEHFSDVHILALESNYDPQMQLASPRPYFLKQRIMNGSGHLSNHQAFSAIREILDLREQARASLPSHIVLLHRSRQCNCPHLLRRLFSQDPRIPPRLLLAEQTQPTPWLSTAHPRPAINPQLPLTFASP